MKLFSTLLLFCCSLASYPLLAQQANLVVFSQEGDQFYLMINGIHQNTEARTNVKVINMPAETAYKLKIVFTDNSVAPITKNFYPAEANMESTFNIKRNRKGIMKAKAFSYSEITTNEAAPNQYLIVYGSPQPEVVEETVVVAPTENNNSNMNTNTTTTTNTTTNTNASNTNNNANVNMNTNVTDNGDGGTVGTTISDGETTVSMNMSVSENGVSVDINENTTGQPVNPNNTTTNSTYTETTTTTTTKVNGQVVDHNSTTMTNTNENNNVNSSVTVTEETVTSNNSTVNNNTTNLALGCLNSADYELLRSAVKAENFDDEKMTVAKQMTPECLNVDQIKGIMKLFDFEDDRLEYAKYTYNRCQNPADFHEVFDLFDFQDNVKALNAYMKENK